MRPDHYLQLASSFRLINREIQSYGFSYPPFRNSRIVSQISYEQHETGSIDDPDDIPFRFQGDASSPVC